MVAPRVWIGSKPCPFAQSIFDTLIASSSSVASAVAHPRDHHADRTMVSIQEEPSGVVSLSLKDSTTSVVGTTCLPMGRARHCSWMDSSACPTTLIDPSLRSGPHRGQTRQQQHPFVRLAVVGLILDPTCQHILITRRPTYMRSFPGAWVLPGGTIQPQETLAQAIQREVYEETGLNTSTTQWTMECLWESVYPTTFPTIGTKGNKEGGRLLLSLLSPDQIQAHHLVIFLSTILSKPPLTLNPCPDEVDGAVWLSKDHVSQIINYYQRTEQVLVEPKTGHDHRVKTLPHLVLHTAAANPKEGKGLVPLQQLLGIYPQSHTNITHHDIGHPPSTTNTNTNTSMLSCGMAEGSLFALEEFYYKQWKGGRIDNP